MCIMCILYMCSLAGQTRNARNGTLSVAYIHRNFGVRDTFLTLEQHLTDHCKILRLAGTTLIGGAKPYRVRVTSVDCRGG
jgi:hypothetical protein